MPFGSFTLSILPILSEDYAEDYYYNAENLEWGEGLVPHYVGAECRYGGGHGGEYGCTGDSKILYRVYIENK